MRMFANFLGYNLTVMFSEFANKIYSLIAKIPFDALVWAVWGSYAAIFLIGFALTLKSKRIKCVSKRPFLCLTNAYTAVNLALFLLKCELAQTVLISALFWVIGYILYGALCAASCDSRKIKRAESPALAAAMPQAAMPAQPKIAHPEVHAAKNSVRLEHAVSVTDKLLSKNLGKSDRQELEKLKNTLAVLQIKGSLSPAESDILNENFNTLLKLMAKYNV